MPRIWRESSNHHIDCYLQQSEEREKMHLPSSIQTASISLNPDNTTGLPVPQPPTRNRSCLAVESFVNSENASPLSSSLSVTCRGHRLRDQRFPYYPDQEDINDLIREVALAKSNANLFISRLKQWDLLDDGDRTTFQRKRYSTFSEFFSFKVDLCYCHDKKALFKPITILRDTSEWQHFIDSSSRNLKAVLLHTQTSALIFL